MATCKRSNLMKRIHEQQQKIGAAAQDKNDPHYLVRNLIGPACLYDLAENGEARAFPWKDGIFSNGITIHNEGRSVHIRMRAPSEDGNGKAEEQDLVAFVYFYLQCLSVQRRAQPELVEALKLVEMALQQMITGTVRDEIRSVVNENVQELSFTFGGKKKPIKSQE